MWPFTAKPAGGQSLTPWVPWLHSIGSRESKIKENQIPKAKARLFRSPQDTGLLLPLHWG